MRNSISYSKSSNLSKAGNDYAPYWEGVLNSIYRKLPSNWYEDDLYVALSFLPYRRSIMLVVNSYAPHLRIVRNEIIRLLGTPFNSRHQGHLSYLEREILIVSKAHLGTKGRDYDGDVFVLEPETTLRLHHVRRRDI